MELKKHITDESRRDDEMGCGSPVATSAQAEAPTEPAGETGLMNNIRSRAEEVVVREYIYEED